MSKQYAKQTRKHREATAKATAQRDRRIKIGLTALIAGVVGWLIITTIPRTDIDLTGQPVIGRKDAPHTLIVFGDFKCPACRAFEADTATAVDQAVENGTLKTAFLHYPFLARAFQLPEDDSTLMARAAECVHSTYGARRHHDLVRSFYLQQGDEKSVWGGKDQLPNLLRGAGFNEQQRAALTTCAASNDSRAAVQRDVAAAEAAKITGTPLVLLDGAPVRTADALISALRSYDTQ